MTRPHTAWFLSLLLGVGGLFSGARAAPTPEAPWVGQTLDGQACQPHEGGRRGPFDYISYKGGALGLIERHHFTPRVEQLQAGQTSPSPIGDIGFTLHAFPNHHRALYSAVRFSLTSEDASLKRRYPAECFLQRAISFSPRDVVPRMLFGLYLHRLGLLDQALTHYRDAEALAPGNVQLLYNLGLLQLDRGDLDSARDYAIKAYKRGMTLPGLRRKLEENGISLAP